MAQTGFTPISLYNTATAAAVPTAGNLVAGELAINTNDGKLFYKDSSGVVQTMASKDANSGSFTNLAYTGTLTGGTGVVNLGSGQVYKDASGNVGIGTASPSYKLVVAGSAPRIVSQDTTNNKIAVLRCGDTVGYVGTESNIPFQVLANSNTIINFSTTGAVGLYGAATNATGVGITFPATQSASSDANTLDDYEEGTFTPTWLGSTTNPVVSGMQSCSYTKVGRLVTITGDMYATSVTGGLGNLSIGNLPFTAASGATSYSGVALGLTTGFNSTGAPTRGYVGSSSNAVQLYTNASSDSRSNTGTACTVANTSLASYSEIYLSFSYITST
jgi:hypothetical protein